MKATHFNHAGKPAASHRALMMRETGSSSEKKRTAAPSRHRVKLLSLMLAYTLAGMAHAGGEAVPVSIEDNEFKVDTRLNTRVLSDSAEKRVETGMTQSGAPVTVTRLSHHKVTFPKELLEQEPPPAQADKGDTTTDATSAGTTDTATADRKEVRTKALDAFKQQLKSDFRNRKPTPFLIHAVTPHSVSIAWAEDDSTVYNVSRDGQVIAQVSGAKYVDETVSPEKEYRYTVEPVVQSTADNNRRATSTSFSISTLPVQRKETAKPESLKAGRSSKAELGDGPTTTVYKHRAFIPSAGVNTSAFENPGCESAPWDQVTYKGDDRDWSGEINLDPNKSRTVVQLTTDWSALPVTTAMDMHVSETIRTINGQQEVRRATPNENWKVAEEANSEGSYARYVVVHRVSNPFCHVGSIFYEETVEMWNDGTVGVSGIRFPAPAHEGLFALYKGVVGYQLELVNSAVLFQAKNDGFACLTGICDFELYEGRNRLSVH